ncbi:LRR receptor-like serine/threonine-protein kinase EFR [Capsicum galapagoense]
MWKGPWYVPELRILDLINNRLMGIIPPSEIGNLSEVAESSFWETLELGKLTNLRVLSFVLNYNLIGEIPEAIFNMSSLEIISFSYNNLSGRIPTTVGLHLPNLERLYLAHNQLYGKIPLVITNASKLEILSLANNFLTGTIPTNLGNLHELQYFFVHTNQLTNEPREHEFRFVKSLADYRMWRYLQVGSNPLNGVLPNSIGNLSSTIENIYISDAHINGLIPTGIGNMSGLTGLDLVGNNLAGSIPSDVVKLKKIQGQYLNNNKWQLQGHIPEAVYHLTNLVNELSGLIPECLGNLMIEVSFDHFENEWSSYSRRVTEFNR